MRATNTGRAGQDPKKPHEERNCASREKFATLETLDADVSGEGAAVKPVMATRVPSGTAGGSVPVTRRSQEGMR
jgi:hypothetical protein